MVSPCLAHSHMSLFHIPSVQAPRFFSSNNNYRSNCVTIETAKLIALPCLSLSRMSMTTTANFNPTDQRVLNLSLITDDDDDLILLNDKDVFRMFKVEMETPTQTHPANLSVYDRTCWHRSRVHSLVGKIRALQTAKDNSSPQIADILDETGELRSSMSGFNDLLSAFVIAKEADIAFILFSNLCSYGLAPDCWTYCIMIRCYCDRNDPDEALRVVNSLLGKGFHPNVATFTTVMNAYSKRGRLQKAMEVFELMETIGCMPTIQTYNCLLKGLCYVGKVEQAFEILMDIKNKACLKPDIYTYTAIMDGFCKVGRSDEAKELLDEVLEMGLQPNVITFNTLFEGYSREGRPQKGISILKQMQNRNCMPDLITYSTLFRGLLKWDKIRSAMWIYNDLVRNGFEMNEKVMNTFLRKICRKSYDEKELLVHANQMFEKMKSKYMVIDMDTFSLLIHALCAGNKVDECLDHLNYMTNLGYSPLANTFEKVIQALCARGEVQDAVSAFVLMYKSQRTPSKSSYDLLIEEFSTKGQTLEACCLYAVVIKNGMRFSYKHATSCRTGDYLN